MQSKLPQEFSKFFRRHHVLTLATVSNNQAWCSSMFYAFLPDRVALVFTSDKSARHSREALVNSLVAGSIVLETRIVGKIQGIQFEGRLVEPEGEYAETARKAYLIRFPYALLANSPFWCIELDYIKLTDNRLGFGKKLHWYRHQTSLPSE